MNLRNSLHSVSIAMMAAMAFTACSRQQEVELKPRIVVCTDIGRAEVEPDDMESAVRLMTYADRYEIEAIITTVGWNCDPYPSEWAEYLDTVVTAYGKDVANLMKRSGQNGFLPLEEENARQELGYWPSYDYIKSRCMMGSQRAGIGVIGEGNDSPGSDFLIKLADEDDPRPIWVTSWGSSNTLAQAIWRVSQTRSAEELKKFVNKFRVYTITDQDMVYAMRFNRAYSSHQWMRKEFKDDLLFIWDEGTWNEQCELGKRNWDKHQQYIQGNANLGSVYPTYLWGVEGDTPSYLHVMPNGLGDPDDPTQVTWGGYHRYGTCPDRETTAWTSWQSPVRETSIDYYTSFYPDMLNDFIARMQWAKDGDGNRNPIVNVNGDTSYKPLTYRTKAGWKVNLDASKTIDPDVDDIEFRWWQQSEAGENQPILSLDNTDQSKISIELPEDRGARYDIICEVHDKGPWSLVSYKRIIIETY